MNNRIIKEGNDFRVKKSFNHYKIIFNLINSLPITTEQEENKLDKLLYTKPSFNKINKSVVKDTKCKL